MSKFSYLKSKYNLDVKKYTYKNRALIIDTSKGKYVIKEKKKNIKEIYDYLLSRNFSFFLYPDDIDNNYEIYSYISEVNTIKEEKAIHLISVLSELQNRTTTYKMYTLDEIKEIYEEKSKKIDYLFKYYDSLEEKFSNIVYPHPYQLSFLINVSKIYNALQYSKMLLEKWYKEVSVNKKKRIVLLHNRLSLDHFLDVKDAKIINFNYADYGSPIFDFVYFYLSHYRELDMLSLFKLYQHKYIYTLEELLRLFIELVVPYEIRFDNNNINNCLKIYNLVSYIDITREFILKQQEKDEKKDNKELSK